MAEESPSGTKEADSSGGEGGLWRGLKALLFGSDAEHTLRREIEDAIDEYDDEEGEEGYADLVEFARLIPVSLSTGREKISLAGSALLSLKVEPSVVLPDQADDAVDQTLDQQHDVVDMLTKDRPS